MIEVVLGIWFLYLSGFSVTLVETDRLGCALIWPVWAAVELAREIKRERYQRQLAETARARRVK